MFKTYQGSCHCGAVRFEADIDLAQGTSKCNCTFCMKVRAWKAFVRPAAFRLLGGGDHATGYHKHPQSPLKYFCRECGVRTHELGSADYMGGDLVGVYVSTLDDVELLELATAPVRVADGRDNNWQNAPSEVRHL